MKTASPFPSVRPAFLTTDQLAARWDGLVTAGTLRNWRSKGKGPAYQTIGKRVTYPLAAIEAYEAANQVAANDKK